VESASENGYLCIGGAMVHAEKLAYSKLLPHTHKKFILGLGLGIVKQFFLFWPLHKVGGT
jgi:hypothetical protein